MQKKWLKIVIFTELVVGGLALGFILVALWYRPLGPAMDLPAQDRALAAESTNFPVIGQPSVQVTPGATATPSSLFNQNSTFIKRPEEIVRPLCGGPSVMNILVVGSDARENGYLYGLADSIRVVRIDFTVPKAMVLDIPRDLWVDIPGISDHYGITQGKINQAYFFGNKGMGYYDGPGEGPGLLARTLEANFGLQVDHYLAVDRKTFVDIINAMGGIDISLGSQIDMNEGQDGANPSLVLEAGNHHLDGDMALKLAINRYPSIFQRARYQNIILSSLQNRLFNPAMIPELPNLVAQFTGSVQTDLSPNDVLNLICIGQLLTPSNTEIVAFPDDLFVSGNTYDPYRKVNTYILSVDIDRFREYLAGFMQGTWPKD